MKSARTFAIIAAASLAAMVPQAASAQGAATSNGGESGTIRSQQDRNEFPWGLLGLLGLAGLLGLKRQDSTPRVDARAKI